MRESDFCVLRSFFPARRRNLGAATFVPSSMTAKWPRPRSIPQSRAAAGSGDGSVSITNEAKNLPAASRTTVTDDGTDGSGRDQRTGTSPIFGRRSRPLSSTLNRALAVNRTACRRSFRDRNRGGATFGPFRFPVTEAKKFRYAMFRSARACWSTTDDTSPSHARSGVFLASASRLDSSASEMRGSPAPHAACRAASASLNTTRAQPNARASASR